jgi:hypothetical protein
VAVMVVQVRNLQVSMLASMMAEYCEVHIWDGFSGMTSYFIIIHRLVQSITINICPVLKSRRQFSECPLLGGLAKLRKATISFVMSVCLSAHMEELRSHWTDLS